MSEMRWDPVKREWVITATHRMDRTFLPPKEYCPLCPTKEGGYETEIPAEEFQIVVFENRFPSLKTPPPEKETEGYPIYPVEDSKGACEVIVYTDKHQGSITGLSKEHMVNLVRVWCDRYEELGKREDIEYILIFENRGEEVGVTLHHPHGQIYAFSYIPNVPLKELESAEEYLKENKSCLFCDLLKTEEDSGSRIVAANDGFTAFVPFYARYPYEIHIYSRRHRASLAHLSNEEEEQLAVILQQVVAVYDNLFEQVFPYIMVIHQDKLKDAKGLGHLHFEFYPPLRNKGKLKYIAGCEQGAGTFINDSLPEEKAAELRAVYERLIEKEVI